MTKIHGFLGGTSMALDPDLCGPVALLVEDEWAIRIVVVQTFQESGWSVLEASTGEGALALIRARPQVHVVITDIQLAGHLSGWDVAEAIRATHPEMPVVYVSGNSVDRSRSVPGSCFLNKPYEPTELLEVSSRLAGLS
jgi:two-component system, OmpR family, response regulator